MAHDRSADHAASLTVVIPSYNSAPWLQTTLDAVDRAISASGLVAEVIVVDDGSTDETTHVLAVAAASMANPLTVLRQPNRGRFLARWAGVSAARTNDILLLDSRVLIEESALRHIVDERATTGGWQGPWNAHAVTSQASALVGSFWDVPTYIFWGSYLAHPVPTLITPETFDHLPKGTTCFLVARELFLDACRETWPEDEQTAHLVSDDTQLLRYIAHATPIRIDPGFAVEYRPRDTVRKFLAHSFVRGTLFVDSYAGTSTLRSATLIALVCAPPVALVAVVWMLLAGQSAWALVVACCVIVALISPAAAAAVRGCSRRGIISYLTYVIPFGFVFWAGLGRGLMVHRSKFRIGARSA